MALHAAAPDREYDPEEQGRSRAAEALGQEKPGSQTAQDTQPDREYVPLGQGTLPAMQVHNVKNFNTRANHNVIRA